MTRIDESIFMNESLLYLYNSIDKFGAEVAGTFIWFKEYSTVMFPLSPRLSVSTLILMEVVFRLIKITPEDPVISDETSEGV